MKKIITFIKEHLLKIIFIVFLAIFFSAFFAFKLNRFFNYDNVLAVREFILGFSFFGPLIILGLYLLFNVVMLPTLFFTFISGYLYGMFYGFFIAQFGMILGLMASFFNSRYLFRKDFIKKFGENKAVVNLENYANKYKGLAVLFFRVFFVFPYNLQNVAYGLCSIKTYSYFWGSSVGILPTTIFYVWLGDMISKNKLSLLDMKNIFTAIGIGITIFASIFFTSILIKKKFRS